MSQMFNIARKTLNRKMNNNYEDLDITISQNSFQDDATERRISTRTGSQEFEMNSVSVVPDDTFTVSHAVNAFGFGKFQVKLSLFTGLCWMADSMEMTILSILPLALHCDWKISRGQQALATTVVFLGMMLSSTFWGFTSDRFGRKKALSLCAALLFFYGLLSSIAPNYLWLLLLRGLVGFAIGCVPQSVTLYAEFLPSKQRAKCVVLLDCFWALGACLEVLLALFIMPALGWRWLLAISTVPLMAFAIICPWIPESARFFIASGQSDKALETLKKVALENGKPMLLGRLVADDTVISERGRMKDLLIPQLRTTSILLWFIWTSCAFCYYGVVLMATELFETSPKGQGLFNTVEVCSADCRKLNTQDYMDLLWTTLAEFPGIFATIFVIEKFGRKNTMALQFLIFSLCIILLVICTMNRVLLTIVLFFARGIIAGVFQAAYVYTPEVYPTQFRAIGVGACSMMARLGAMITPHVAQVLIKSSLSTAMLIYCIVAVMAACCCLKLPVETKGKEMKEGLTKD